MAIQIEQIEDTYAEMKKNKVKITVNSMQGELSRKYNSHGNRNMVAAKLKLLRDADCCATVKSSKTNKGNSNTSEKIIRTNPSEVDSLPDTIRKAVLTLIATILAVIGKVRKDEREAATQIIYNAEQEIFAASCTNQETLEQLHADKWKLSEENASLRKQLNDVTAKSEQLLITINGIMGSIAPYTSPNNGTTAAADSRGDKNAA